MGAKRGGWVSLVVASVAFAAMLLSVLSAPPGTATGSGTSSGRLAGPGVVPPGAPPLGSVPRESVPPAAVADGAERGPSLDIAVAGPDPGGGPAAGPPTAQDASQEAERQADRARRAAVRTVTIALTGDILLHLPVTAAAASPSGGYDFRPLLAPIASDVAAADLALCHLEVPLSRDGSRLSGYPVFNAPPQLAEAIAATGYEGCSTASNHSLDQRPDGVAATLDVLDAAGVGHAGTARSAAEDVAPRLYRAGGLLVGHVSATYGLNGFVMPADQPWLVDLIDPVQGVLAEAAAARVAGADIVVVSVHWGEEYSTAPSDYQRAVAGQLLASPDVDLIAGHHAHVVQPVERVGDKVVVFGLGNLLSGQLGRHTAGTQDGVVVTVTLVDSPTATPRVLDIGYVPTWVEPGTYRVLPIPQALTDPTLSDERRTVLEASAARTAAALGLASAPSIGTSSRSSSNST